jgi:hypothetical protein
MKTSDTTGISIAAAAQEVEKGMRLFRVFEHAHQALTLLENLEQVQRERKAAAEAAQGELDTVRKAIEAAQSELEAKKAEAAEAEAAGRERLAAIEEAEKLATTRLKAARVELVEAEAELGAASDQIARARRLQEALAGLEGGA